MFLDYLSLRLVLSFVVGGSWVTLVTWVDQRFGSSIGGIMAGIPSAAAFSLFFIGWIVSTSAAVQATNVFPLAYGFTICFPMLYAFFAKERGFGFGMLAAFSIWGSLSVALSVFVVVSGFEDFGISLLGCFVVSAAGYFLLMGRQPLKGSTHGLRPDLLQLSWRFVFSGSVVASAVLVSQVATPVVGGVFAAFPAVFTSTIYLIYTADGKEASREITRPMVVSATLTVVPYSIVVRFAYPAVGIWIGTALSYGAVIPLAVLAYLLLRRTAHRESSKAFEDDPVPKGPGT